MVYADAVHPFCGRSPAFDLPRKEPSASAVADDLEDGMETREVPELARE